MDSVTILKSLAGVCMCFGVVLMIMETGLSPEQEAMLSMLN